MQTRHRPNRSLYTNCKVGLALLVIACTVFASGCAPWRHGTRTRPVVNGIDFLGAKRIPKKDLEDSIQSRATGRLPFSQPQYLDPNAVDTDEARLERYYQSRGFYDAHVYGWRFAWSQPGKGRLGFIIDEGPRVYVDTVNVEGLDALPRDDRRFVLKGLTVKRGTPLDEDRYEDSKREILRRLRLRGYAQAEVAGEVHVYPEELKAVVRIATDPGDRYRLGPVKVVGNRHTSATPIVWASALKPGQIYSVAKIDQAQGSIYDLGAFRAVSIETGNPDPQNRMPVTIRVQESKLNTIQSGVGVAIDRTREQAQGSFSYKNRNLFGGLDQLDATIRGGYAVLPSVYERRESGPIWGGDVTFRRPNFLQRALVLSAQATYDRTIEEAYDSDSGRGTIGIDKIIRDWDFGAGYGLLVYRLTDIRIASQAAGISPKATPDRCPEPCIISFVQPHVSWDRRNDPVEPRNGAYLNVELEKGGGILGGTHDYYRAEPEIRLYQTPLFWKQRLTFAGRARTGWLIPTSGVSPIVRRFYSGGPDSMRGYATRRLSPMAHAQDGTLVPIGGDQLLEASGEARFFLGSRLVLASFLDVGSVEFAGRSIFDPARMAMAVGPGIRYLSPIGPIRFDVGYRFKTPVAYTIDSPPTKVSDPLWSFHVGLGEAF